MKPFFSFYGAKWRGSKYYPGPAYNIIIEPFAGSACYSTRYYKNNIILNDLDPTIANLWDWLIKAKPEDIDNAPHSLRGFWYNKGSSSPATMPSAWMRSGKWPNQFWGDAIKLRLKTQVPSIKHWSVSNKSYKDLDNVEATWFVDPPYQQQGKHYKFNNTGIDFKHLGEWCKERKGQVIVCEQEGADWLPFEPFKSLKSLKSRQSKEVYYEHRENSTSDYEGKQKELLRTVETAQL